MLFLNIIGFILGSTATVCGIWQLDTILRRRNKNGLWLIIFFGPLSLFAIFAEKFLDLENSALVVLYICAASFIGLPTAIWGFLEISAGMKEE